MLKYIVTLLKYRKGILSAIVLYFVQLNQKEIYEKCTHPKRSQYYPNVAEGKLTQLYIDTAEAFLQSKGFNVKHAKAESDYNALEEVEKFKWADFFIIQYPVYWMNTMDYEKIHR